MTVLARAPVLPEPKSCLRARLIPIASPILTRRLGDVDHPELRPLAAAVAVHRQRPGEMNRRALEAEERLAELLARGAERDPLDRPPVASDGADAQMAPVRPDRHDLRQAVA